jgi:hypothetical protein
VGGIAAAAQLSFLDWFAKSETIPAGERDEVRSRLCKVSLVSR